MSVSAAVILPAASLVFLLSKPISAYAMGEGYAQSLGVNTRRFRALLIVPHICRMMLRTSKPLPLIPACFIGGASLCMLCDLAARTVFSPVELSVSTVTAAIGAPIVIWLMVSRRSKREN